MIGRPWSSFRSTSRSKWSLCMHESLLVGCASADVVAIPCATTGAPQAPNGGAVKLTVIDERPDSCDRISTRFINEVVELVADGGELEAREPAQEGFVIGDHDPPPPHDQPASSSYSARRRSSAGNGPAAGGAVAAPGRTTPATPWKCAGSTGSSRSYLSTSFARASGHSASRLENVGAGFARDKFPGSGVKAFAFTPADSPRSDQFRSLNQSEARQMKRRQCGCTSRLLKNL
jgi:hypothetical protein